MCIDLLFLGVIVIIVFYLDNTGFVIIASRYIALPRTLPLLERRHHDFVVWRPATNVFNLVVVLICCNRRLFGSVLGLENSCLRGRYHWSGDWF